MSIDLTVLSYVIFSVVVYYAVLFAMSRWRPSIPDFPDSRPLFVAVVPARNEGVVIAATLRSLSQLVYDGEYRVLVVDDGSTDDTGEIVDQWAARDSRIRVMHRAAPDAGIGKSAVLNAAFRAIQLGCVERDPWFDGRSRDDVVMAIVDADGQLERTALETVAPYFGDAVVGSVQVGVRIGNAATSTLARMQDMEFVGFTWLVQIARDRLGSSGLGGNGQFTRLSALTDVGQSPWAVNALTEDLDIGLRLVRLGWQMRFCHRTYVSQQGLVSWRPLLRQRTRWIQGHYQCWRHILPLLRSRRVKLATRLDLTLYLLLVVTVILVSGALVVSVLAGFGVVTVVDGFLDGVPVGVLRQTLSLTLGILPLVAFMWTYQRHSDRPFRWFEVPAFAMLFTLYTYAWLIATARALTRLALRRNSWVKTPRVPVVDAPAPTVYSSTAIAGIR